MNMNSNDFDPRNPPEHIYRVPSYYRSRSCHLQPKVQIGVRYAPAIRITPSVHISGEYAGLARSPSATQQCIWAVGIVAGFSAFIGLSHMLFG